MIQRTDAYYESAIAQRNMTWAAFRQAEQTLRDAEAAGITDPELKFFRHARNTTLENYEDARDHLLRVKVWRQHRWA